MQGNRKTSRIWVGKFLRSGCPDSVTAYEVGVRIRSEQALEHLAEDGLISLLVYRGHEGGGEEYTAIRQWPETRACPWRCPDQGDRPEHAPVLIHLGPGIAER